MLVQTAQVSPELADAADVLSDQLREHLQRLAIAVEPHVDKINRRFLNRLRELEFQPKQRTALAQITPGAAARVLVRGRPPLHFIEQVEYNGRRLAKLNLPPSAILAALEEYDRLLGPLLASLIPDEHANFQWVREQLHFCVILTLNNAYYQVREIETQAFYELFRIELESRNLHELTLERRGDVVGHRLGRRAWIPHLNLDDRIVDSRQVVDREAPVGQHAKQDRGHGQDDRHHGTTDEGLGQAHDVPPATCTLAPGITVICPVTTTRSPAATPFVTTTSSP